MQGLTSGYFLLYTTPLIGLWALFFLRARLHAWMYLGVFWLAAFALLWPWLSAYRAVHARYGFDRGINEVAELGADIGGLLKASPLLTGWGTWLADTTREEQLFPGLTLACAVVVAVATSRYWRPPLLTRATSILMGAAAVFLTAAAVAYFAPIDFRVAAVKIGLTRPHKPLGVAWLLLGAALLSTRPVRRAVADRSVPAFYALTAVALAVLSLGPAPRLFGVRIWYRAPYAWLMSLPGFDAVRVPARFWLLTTLCLSVVLAFGLTRLRALGTRSYYLVVGGICVGLLVDGWFRMPLLPLPARIQALETSVSREPVLELPLGPIESETAAMYRATTTACRWSMATVRISQART
jgi:hypothetical protein